MDRPSRPAHDERMGGIGTERREVEFEPLPEEPVHEPAPAEPAHEPEPEPVPA